MSDKKIDAQAAGYMELEGATKDADCSVVEVPDGVSSEKGCCNNFWPPTAKKFSCGECDYVEGANEQPEENRPLGKRETRKMSDLEIINSPRPAREYK